MQPVAGPSQLSSTSGNANDVAARDELFATVARRCMRDLHASAVAVYLRVPGESTLAAVVVVVAPLAPNIPECLPLDDPLFPMVRAYQTGRICMVQGQEIAAQRLECAAFAYAPHSVAAAPLLAGKRRVGALSVFTPRDVQEPSKRARDYLRDTVEHLSAELDRLTHSAATLCPPQVPLVVAPEDAAVGEADRTSPEEGFGFMALRSGPFVHHVHKLILSLMPVVHAEDAIAVTIDRLVSGFGARAVAISLIDGDRLYVAGASGCSREHLKSLNGLSISTKSPETEAIRHKRLIVETEQRDQWPGTRRVPADAYDEHLWVAVPLVSGSHALGVCSVGFAPEQDLLAARMSPLATLATLVGQALERAQLYDSGRALAQKLQATLLPRILPQLAGVLSTSRYEPAAGATELGGDWYDLIRLPDGGVAAVIGDVEGHSTTAAVVMGQLSSAVRSYALEGHDPSTVLYRANRLLIEAETGVFATCCCVWLDPDTGTAQVVSAGHPSPLIRTADGAYLTAVTDIGVPLGVDACPSYQAIVHTLDPATLCVLYTDGLSGREYELPRETLEAAIAASSDELETLGDRLMRPGSGWAPRADDAALLLLRYEGPSANAKESIKRLHVHRHDFQGVRHARQFLAACLDYWHLVPLSDSAELLTSEVVTNALVHGDSDVDVCLRMYPDHLRVEVRDSDSHPAMLMDLGPEEGSAEGGRGILIVSALASSWGNSPSGRGKTVWFELDTQTA